MRKILWLSRHEMTKEQREDLERIYGEIEVKIYNQAVSGWQEVVEVGSDCEVLAVVLPTIIISDLVKPRNNIKPVIQAKVNRVPTGTKVINPVTGREEDEYKFLHIGWEQVIGVKVVTKNL